jgi:benzoylformate decarboxylase
MTAGQRQAAVVRAQELAAGRQEDTDALRKDIEQEADQRPITARTLISALNDALPPDAVFVDEAPSVNQNLLARLGCLADPSGHFAHRGWGLGWGMGCALGVKLAWPERPVLGLLGDGASLYGIQGLWTAARYNIPATFVIANNTQYKILKFCGDVMNLPAMCNRDYVGMDITNPEVDYIALARGFGVEAHRVTEPDEVAERVRNSFSRQKPLLLDVPIER